MSLTEANISTWTSSRVCWIIYSTIRPFSHRSITFRAAHGWWFDWVGCLVPAFGFFPCGYTKSYQSHESLVWISETLLVLVSFWCTYLLRRRLFVDSTEREKKALDKATDSRYSQSYKTSHLSLESSGVSCSTTFSSYALLRMHLAPWFQAKALFAPSSAAESQADLPDMHTGSSLQEIVSCSEIAVFEAWRPLARLSPLFPHLKPCSLVTRDENFFVASAISDAKPKVPPALKCRLGGPRQKRR